MRRFIAGAICPECRAVDRIVVEREDGVRHRRCVACGHSEAFTESLALEPATRLTGRAHGATPTQPVRFVAAPTPPRDRNAEDPSE